MIKSFCSNHAENQIQIIDKSSFSHTVSLLLHTNFFDKYFHLFSLFSIPHAVGNH